MLHVNAYIGIACVRAFQLRLAATADMLDVEPLLTSMPPSGWKHALPGRKAIPTLLLGGSNCTSIACIRPQIVQHAHHNLAFLQGGRIVLH